MEDVRKVSVGDSVTFIDPKRVSRAALVTAVWSPTCINVVFVSGDPNRNDSFGRQTEHETSVVHSSLSKDEQYNVIGRCWE